MIETNDNSTHLASIIPLSGPPLQFGMPWHDSLMQINNNYHAVERAINTAALAGSDTIWLVMHRGTQPLLRKRIGEWIYDPKSTWVAPNVFWNKKEIPIYYIAINDRDKGRKDSYAWSCLYGAKIASHVSKKISKWLMPKRFLVISPFGIVDDKTIEDCREKLRGDKNIIFSSGDKTFLDNNNLPFTFDQIQYELCNKNFREIYTYKDSRRSFSDIFSRIDLSTYDKVNVQWHHNIDNWDGYRNFIGSKNNLECSRPKYMVARKWWGMVKDHD